MKCNRLIVYYLMEKCNTDQLQMHKELSFHEKLGCSVLDVHNNQPETQYNNLGQYFTILDDDNNKVDKK